MSPASAARFAKVSEAMSRVGTKNRWYVIPYHERWVVLRERARRATRVLGSRAEAVEIAQALARHAGGEVVINRKDGRMQEHQVADQAGGQLKTVYFSSGSPD
jgi:adenine/guanine phosphoribosyltransferase-like PRPP-binding protein